MIAQLNEGFRSLETSSQVLWGGKTGAQDWSIFKELNRKATGKDLKPREPKSKPTQIL